MREYELKFIGVGDYQGADARGEMALQSPEEVAIEAAIEEAIEEAIEAAIEASIGNH